MCDSEAPYLSTILLLLHMYTNLSLQIQIQIVIHNTRVELPDGRTILKNNSRN